MLGMEFGRPYDLPVGNTSLPSELFKGGQFTGDDAP
jgi:hypothetical protein